MTRGGKRAIGSATPFEWFEADATDSRSVQRACAGAAVVYHCAGASYHRWAELLPRMMDGIAGAARVAEAKLIYADNLYLYGKVAGPMNEDLPSNPNSRKGQVRAQLADRLLEAHARGALRAAIGRGSDFFGPNVLLSHAGNRLFPQALAGKPTDALGDPDKLHSFTFIDDFAAALVVLGEREEALGRAWHVPTSEPLSHRAFIERVYRLAGTEPKLRSRAEVGRVAARIDRLDDAGSEGDAVSVRRGLRGRQQPLHANVRARVNAAGRCDPCHAGVVSAGHADTGRRS